MLVTMKEILDKARDGGYGVPAPNADNEFNVRAYISAAEEMNSPLIIGVLSKSNPDIVYFGRIITDLAIRSKVPIAINLDHSKEFAQAIRGIRAGLTSIMVDRSELPFEDNVAQVKELARIAHSVGVSVEAELGHVGRGVLYEVDGVSNFTDPDMADQFVKETGIDCLAVAIGTAHGAYKGTPKLHYDILEKIRDKVSVPLVLHGGSGTGDENIAKACRLGINKVNLSFDMKQAAIEAIYEADLINNSPYKLWSVMSEGIRKKLTHYMSVCGSEGKAFS